MEQFYEELQEILYPGKELDPTIHKSIRQFEPIQIALKELIIALKESKNPNLTKKQHDKKNKIINKKIRTIMYRINEISKKNFLHLKRIIKGNNINEEELNLALRILNEEQDIKETIKKADIYKKHTQNIRYLEKEKSELENSNNQTLNLLEEYLQENKKEFSFLEKILKRKEIKERKKNIQNKLIKDIEHLIYKCKEYNLNKKTEALEIFKNQILNNKKINHENAKLKINDTYQALKEKIIIKKNNTKKEIKEIKIPLEQEQLDAMIMKDDVKNHLYDMAFSTFSIEKEKKKTLLGRILITLKLITVIQQKNLKEEQINYIVNPTNQIKKIENNINHCK